MRQLSNYEVEQVSGAGVIADTLEGVGKAIGGVVHEFGMPYGGQIGGLIGKGVGTVAELGISTVSKLVGHIFGHGKESSSGDIINQ